MYRCPRCGGVINHYVLFLRCPECGYWATTEEYEKALSRRGGGGRPGDKPKKGGQKRSKIKGSS